MKSIGQKGEDAAAYWLSNKGYQIISRNWRVRTGEIDIIAVKHPFIIFIEVKTLLKISFDNLDIIVGKKKQAKIIETAKCFLVNNRDYEKMYVRFDVIVIQSNPFLKQIPKIIHLTNAFGAFYE